MKGLENHSSWQAYDEETLATIMTPGRGDTTTLAHPKESYTQMHRIIRREQNLSEEFGEWIDDAALHNPLAHL